LIDGSRANAVIRITDGKTRGAREGEIVEARLTSFPDARRVAQGVVEEKLGFLGEPGVDIEIVLRSHGLPPRFPEQVVEEAEAFPDEVPEDELLGRRDFRDHRIVTIDGETARDFDDAVEVERTAHGFRLGVHIADVSRYVAEGTARRGGAFARHVRVLPGRSCRCSRASLQRPLLAEPARGPAGPLRDPGDGQEGRVTKSEFVKGVIRSAHRMTYTDVAASETPRVGGSEALRRSPRRLPGHGGLAALRERREARGSIDSTCPMRTSCWTTRASSSGSSRNRATSPTG
jgi:ribonuclease R